MTHFFRMLQNIILSLAVSRFPVLFRSNQLHSLESVIVPPRELSAFDVKPKKKKNVEEKNETATIAIEPITIVTTATIRLMIVVFIQAILSLSLSFGLFCGIVRGSLQFIPKNDSSVLIWLWLCSPHVGSPFLSFNLAILYIYLLDDQCVFHSLPSLPLCWLLFKPIQLFIYGISFMHCVSKSHEFIK